MYKTANRKDNLKPYTKNWRWRLNRRRRRNFTPQCLCDIFRQQSQCTTSCASVYDVWKYGN